MTEVPKKKSKGFIGIAIMLVVALVVNIACAVFQTAINSFMAANLNPIITGQGSSGIESLGLTPEQATEASREITRELEAEGLVLLRNEDDVLPLEEGPRSTSLATPRSRPSTAAPAPARATPPTTLTWSRASPMPALRSTRSSLTSTTTRA